MGLGNNGIKSMAELAKVKNGQGGSREESHWVGVETGGRGNAGRLAVSSSSSPSTIGKRTEVSRIQEEAQEHS